jgi:hypothetical protein
MVVGIQWFPSFPGRRSHVAVSFLPRSHVECGDAVPPAGASPNRGITSRRVKDDTKQLSHETVILVLFFLVVYMYIYVGEGDKEIT